MRTFYRRLRDRITAGRIAAAYLIEAETGTVPILPKGAKRLSNNELCAAVADDLGITAANNIETRVLRPSLPVIHVCAAYAVTMREVEVEKGSVPTLNALWEVPPLLGTILRRAEQFESLLQQSRLKIDSTQLIPIRMRIA